MNNRWILGRPGSGKTKEAVRHFISGNKERVFFSLGCSKDELMKTYNIDETYKDIIFDNCMDMASIIKTIWNCNKEIDCVIIDNLQLIQDLDLKILINFLNNKDITLTLVSQVDKDGEIIYENIIIKETRGLFKWRIKVPYDNRYQ